MILPCIRCDAELKPALPDLDDAENQPMNGCCFWTSGHYGTAVFDHADGSRLEINVCDKCLEKAIRDGVAAPPSTPKRSEGHG